MPATQIEKKRAQQEAATPSPEQRTNTVLRELMSTGADPATPETVEELLDASGGEDEQWIYDGIAAEAEHTLHEIKISAAPADVLDPEGATQRQRDVEAMTTAAHKEIANALATETAERVTAADVHEAIVDATNDPSAENLDRLQTLRTSLTSEMEEEEKNGDTEQREMLASLVKPIDAILANKSTESNNAS